jgi:hypothetical protein
MINFPDDVEKIKGMVSDIYDDFDTLESIVKDRAVAFRLDIVDDKGIEEQVIVIYDKNAVKLGLIKIGEPLTCFGNYSGTITAIDSRRNIVEKKMFLCIGIMGSTDIDEEQLMARGAIKLG